MRIGFTKPQSKTVQITGVGPVVLRRNRRARRLTLRICTGKPVTLTLPFFISEKSALAFLNANREWALQKIRTIAAYQPPVVVLDGSHPIKTRTHHLELHPSDGVAIKIAIHSGIIRIQYPADEPVTSPRIQKGIAQGLIMAYRMEANQYLPERVKELAAQFGFRYGCVTVKDLKSRWGSCSAANNINLNLHLMRLPDALIDYVILHELMHTRIGNHGPVFWAELNKILPSVKSLRNHLKSYAQRGFLDSVLVGH